MFSKVPSTPQSQTAAQSQSPSQQQHPQFSFITSAFNAKIDQKKEAAKSRLRREMDYIVHDLFSLFSAEFNHQLYCHLGNAANALKNVHFRSLTAGGNGSGPYLNTSLLADAIVNQVFNVGNNGGPFGYKENIDSSNLPVPVAYNPIVGMSPGAPPIDTNAIISTAISNNTTHPGVIVKKVAPPHLDTGVKRPLSNNSNSVKAPSSLPLVIPVPGTSKLKANNRHSTSQHHQSNGSINASSPNLVRGNEGNVHTTTNLTRPSSLSNHQKQHHSKGASTSKHSIPSTSKTLIVPLIRKAISSTGNNHNHKSPQPTTNNGHNSTGVTISNTASPTTNNTTNQCHLNSLENSEDEAENEQDDDDDDDCECDDCAAEEIKMESIEDHGNDSNDKEEDEVDVVVESSEDEAASIEEEQLQPLSDDGCSTDNSPSVTKKQRTLIVCTKPSLTRSSLVEQPFPSGGGASATTSIQTSTIIVNPNFQVPNSRSSSGGTTLSVVLPNGGGGQSNFGPNSAGSEHYQISLNPEDVFDNEDDQMLDMLEPDPESMDQEAPNVVVPSRKYRTLCLKCTIHDCVDMFKTRAMLHKHLFDTHQVLPNQCVVSGCNKSFNQKLTDHVRTEHAHLTEWQCRHCHKVFKHYQPLYNHISRAHLEGQFQCAAVANCGYIGRFRGEMEAHYYRVHNRHNLQKPYRCTWVGCSFVSSWASHAIRHIRVNHLNLPKTLKEQRERNIVEERNPMDYLEVIQEGTCN